ncbi:MAG: hypothetical protein AAF226_04245 [Verrucomicrobiota bacterium]
MFSDKDFIAASREFVCVRLETYESKEHEKLIRSLYDNKFTNTVFCVLSPEGERITNSHRGPTFSSKGSKGKGTKGKGSKGESKGGSVIGEMKKITARYEAKAMDQPAVLQDFHSFRQALNVASGDQRLLVFATDNAARDQLAPVMSDPAIIGLAHLDIHGADDQDWKEKLSGLGEDPGVLIIQSGQFGLKGTVLEQLPITASSAEIKTALLSANQKFAATEERKVYSDHVADGRKNRIRFEMEVPYGEDRDGDGKADAFGRKGKGN